MITFLTVVYPRLLRPGHTARAEQARIDNAPVRLCVWHCTYQFVERLPSDVPMDQTEIACMTMEVTKVVLGDLIVDPATVPQVEQGSLL